MPVGGRVAGKGGGVYSSSHNGRSQSGVNETIIWTSVGMGITITLLITIALCYIAREKCKKRHEPYR
ncbi:uncharacterized protein LOC107981691 [Nasonia vitripennis]|uniref:Uncharacterized protein n=1 Tax=Nasonia vitripennis TaxID=7425 RepID=A0A7M7QDE5_NASVI|nr:uncharacterized protein LOC107981691 [Nasonia vitripennis]XP_031784827.1 uncharacterized protein LOC107981691 [Nasonia vitripennis]